MFFTNLILVLYSINDYQTRIEKEDAAYLFSTSERIDRDLNNGVKRIAATFLETNNYNDYIHIMERSGKKNLLLFKLQEVLKQMLYGYEEIYSDCAVYYPGSEELVSARYGYFQLTRDSNKSYRALYNIDRLNTLSNGLTISAGERNHKISASLAYKFGNDAIAIFLLNEEYFSNLFYKDFKALSEIDGIFITESSGKLVYHNGLVPAGWDLDDLPVGKILQDISKNSRIKGVDGNLYLGSHTYIEPLGLDIIKVKKENAIVLLKAYSQLLTLFGILTILAMAVSGLVTYLYSKKMYAPFKRLASKVLDEAAPERSGHADEVEVIDTYIRTSKQKITEIENMLSSSKLVIKSKFIKYLLTNDHPSDKDVDEYSSVLKLHFIHPYFTAVYCSLDPISLSAVSYADRSLLQMQLIRQMEANCSDEDSLLLACDYSDNTIGIIINSENIPVLKDNILRLKALVEKYLSDNWNISCFLSVGSVQETACLSENFAAAVHNSEYHFFLEPSTVIFYEDDKPQTNADSFHTCIMLINSCSSKKSDILNAIEQVRNKCLNHMELDDCKKIFSALSQQILHFTNSNHIALSNADVEKLIKPEKFFWTADSYFFYMEKELSLIRLGEEETEPDLYKRINSYISKNLSEPLSLEILAEHYQIHPKYLSKVYKETTGQNITAYILGKRLEKSIDLLKETDWSIERIAAEVGFSSSGYFIRCFRTKSGVTPKAYRELLRK